MSAPLFSVIIPTFNRPQALAACLAALAGSTVPHSDYEVIVVDDGGADDPASVVTQAARSLPVTLLRQPHSGPAAARNTGVAAAQGQFLAFTDDDCMPSGDWLERLAGRFGQQADCAVGGRTLNALTSNPYASASQLLNHFLYDYYQEGRSEAGFFTGNNLAVPRTSFVALGGFCASFPIAAAEDREFCHRWRHHGFGFVYAPEAIVHHAHDVTLPAFVRQHLAYGKGAHHYHLLLAARQQPALKVEPLVFYRDLLRYPFRHQRARKALGQSVLLALAQAVYAIGYFCERIVTDRRSARGSACTVEATS